MVEAVRVLWMVWKAYHLAKADGRNAYVAITYRGVPKVAVFLGVGREAWRISRRAVEEFEAPK